MPNGGSDCCGTCWLNAKDKGEAGYSHSNDPEPDYCTIRDIFIDDPFYTYCANHPHRFPEKETVPVGPVWTSDGQKRSIWKPSPDNEEIRTRLLQLLSEIKEVPTVEYIGESNPGNSHEQYRDEVVVWQIGEFREERALRDLQRISQFDASASVTVLEFPNGHRVYRTRATLVSAALAAIGEIEAGSSGV